jgi:hypothetical protein
MNEVECEVDADNPVAAESACWQSPIDARELTHGDTCERHGGGIAVT